MKAEYRIVKDGIYYSLRLVCYREDGSLDFIDDQPEGTRCLSVDSLRQYYEELGQAISKAAMDWETVPEHQRGYWVRVGNRHIKIEHLSVADLPDNCSKSA